MMPKKIAWIQKTALLIVAVLTIVSGPVHAGDSLPMIKPEKVGFSSERLQRIDRYLQGLVDQKQRAGFVYLVARKGKIAHFNAVGWADIDKKLPMTRETIFAIWSMSKPITASTLLTYYEEGHFDLQDTLSKHIPAFHQPKVLKSRSESGELVVEDAEREIEVWNLFNHTAGFSYSFWGDELAPIYNEAHLWEQGNLESFTNKLATLPILFHPGTGFKYSVGIDVLGRLAEIFSGKPLDETMRTRVWQPLGMKDTDFYVPEEKLPRFAQMYKNTEDGSDLELAYGEPGVPVEKPATFSGGGGLYSTASDYWRFAQMLLNKGQLNGQRVLGRKTVELMTTNALPDSLRPIMGGGRWHRGFGWGLSLAVLTDHPANQILGSPGEYRWDGGSNVYFWNDPQEELIGILMFQHEPWEGSIYRQYKTLVYQALVD
jgi:CubicO group peptidase (beta-lactamase class C family)